MRQDLELFEVLYPIAIQLAQLLELINDTIALSEHKTLFITRLVYKFAKFSNLGSELGQLIDDLGKRYRAYGQRKPKTELP